jgi:CubicO group peptidase (beta-lactamase class C family)
MINTRSLCKYFNWFGLFIVGALVVGFSLRADPVDDTVTALMAKRHIPGLSLAIIQNGKIVKAQGYGVIEIGRPDSVTTDTLFQAGSVSKAVSALGALSLVGSNKLSLDVDVNAALKTWHVPENTFTKESKVTLRRLLSHSAGLTGHGFHGYAVDARVPSLVQVLDGEKPANSAPIRVNLAPGSKWRYSGGGYTVLQQLMIDVTEQPFPEFMQKTVFEPLDMHASTYEQPLSVERAKLAATGYVGVEKPVPGRWHIYPEMAAAGLWTTPSDLARFEIALQESLAGRNNAVISQAVIREMLTRQLENYGLGVLLSGQGKTQRFEHSGRNEGFDAIMVAYLETGQGAVIMINANDNSNVMRRVLETIADVYHWPDYPRHE